MTHTREDASMEVSIAEAFGRPAPAWALRIIAVEASAEDVALARVDLNLAAAFRREPDPKAVAIVEAADQASAAPASFVSEDGVRKRVQ